MSKGLIWVVVMVLCVLSSFWMLFFVVFLFGLLSLFLGFWFFLPLLVFGWVFLGRPSFLLGFAILRGGLCILPSPINIFLLSKKRLALPMIFFPCIIPNSNP